jgi:hypothetical protein
LLGVDRVSVARWETRRRKIDGDMLSTFRQKRTNWIIRSETDLALPRWYLRRRRIRRAA